MERQKGQMQEAWTVGPRFSVKDLTPGPSPKKRGEECRVRRKPLKQRRAAGDTDSPRFALTISYLTKT